MLWKPHDFPQIYSWKLLRRKLMFSRFIVFCFYNCALKICSSLFYAVTLLEMIVVFNQWNMYGLTILFPPWILEWKVVHMWIASWSVLKIWDNKYPNVDVFPWHLLSDLKTALVQGDDFSSGASSRSTKLIHGGVRYLQKAIMKLDYKQVNASFFLRSWHLSAEFLVPLVILLYLPSHVHFSFTGSSDMFALNDCLPGIFWSCSKEIVQRGRPLLLSYGELIHEIISQ